MKILILDSTHWEIDEGKLEWLADSINWAVKEVARKENINVHTDLIKGRVSKLPEGYDIYLIHESEIPFHLVKALKKTQPKSNFYATYRSEKTLRNCGLDEVYLPISPFCQEELKRAMKKQIGELRG